MRFVSGPNQIWKMDADGSNETQIAGPGSQPSWSPDGNHIAFVRFDGAVASNTDIYRMEPDGTAIERLTDRHGERPHAPTGRRTAG